MNARPVWLFAALAVVITACTPGGASPSAAAPATSAPSSGAASPGAAIELQVYGAASLKAVLEELAVAYEAANAGTTLTVSTDSSAALETKIEEGAPADVFLSADTANPQKLVDGGFASGEVVPFAGNLLTIVVPSDNPAGIAAVADLAKPGVKVVAAADGVPIQKYTAQLLDSLPPEVKTGYEANVASREDNVGAIVAKIGLGEGDAGVVYVTDAMSADDVSTVEIPSDVNVPATYGGVVVGASPNVDAAGAFLDWLIGAEGQAILAEHHFQPAP